MPATRRKLGIALAFAGLLLLMLGAWSMAQLRISLARGPMLRSPFGLAVTSDGGVLVGVDGSRIHVYDAQGGFVRAWNVPSSEGRFRLQLAGENRVRVATEAPPRLLELDLEGGIGSERPDLGAFARFGAANDFHASGPSGERYSIETGGLMRLTPAPVAPIVPALRWPLSFFIDYLPLLAVVVGLGSVGLFAGLALTAKRAAVSSSSEAF